MKIGKAGAAELKVALDLAKAGKDTEAVAKIAVIGKADSIGGKFVRGVSQWGDKLISIIEKLPGGRITKGLKETIIEWIHLFQQGAKASRNVARGSRRLASAWKGLSQAEKVANVEKLISSTKGTGLFKGYKAVNPSFWNRWVRGGSPRVWELFTKSERSTRSLMRKTKWYAGLLDWMGIANFVGPEELNKQYGEKQMGEMVNQYNKTPEADKYWIEDFGNVEQPSTEETPSMVDFGKEEESINNDPFMKAFNIFLA